MATNRVFRGCVTGFTIGMGSTLALLPPQNATGNYIKIVQRLPVRIELEGYDPDKKPLFIGASVVPYVYLNKPLSGPNAGTFLQGFEQQSSGPPAQQVVGAVAMRELSGRPEPPAAAANSTRSAAVGALANDAFTALDGATSPERAWIHAGARSAEAGFEVLHWAG